MSTTDSASDLDRIRQEIEACAPEFEKRERPWNQAGLTLLQVCRSLVEQLAKTRAERDQLGRQQQALLDLCKHVEQVGASNVSLGAIYQTVITDPADCTATDQNERKERA